MEQQKLNQSILRNLVKYICLYIYRKRSDEHFCKLICGFLIIVKDTVGVIDF